MAVLRAADTPLTAGQVRERLAARPEPRDATWLLTGAAVVLAGCSTVALALLAASAAARVPIMASLGHYSQNVMHRSNHTPAVTGAVAAVVLTVAAVALALAFRH